MQAAAVDTTQPAGLGKSDPGAEPAQLRECDHASNAEHARHIYAAFEENIKANGQAETPQTAPKAQPVDDQALLLPAAVEVSHALAPCPLHLCVHNFAML